MQMLMKSKILLFAGLLFGATAAMAQNPYIALEGAMEGADGIVVSMPRTVLAVDLTVERTVTLCGPYARYAQKYLGVRAPLTDKTTWSVVGARIALSGDDLYDAGEPAAPQQRVLQHASSDEEFARVQPDKMSMVVPSLEDAARAEFTKLEHGDEENHALWKWFIEISLREYQKTYDQLGITFDSYKGESFYYDKVSSVVETLREKGLLKVDDGASIVDLSEYKMPPCMILKNDGSSIYPSRDIAAAVYRMDTYRFDKCIYVTSAGQSLHFAQWFKVVELMGYDWYDRLVHVPYGTCSINGAKLATRTGNVVLLKDLFATAIEKARAIIEEKNPAMENKDAVAEAVGVGAMIFYYLSNNRMKDINFVMEDALSFDGNTGPYAQYTYARTCSILAKEGETRLAPVSSLCREERELIKTLSLFPEKVLTAIADYEPSVITRYILDICNDFNRFYQACPINSAPDADTKAFRRALTKCTGEILARALELICMKHPEKI